MIEINIDVEFSIEIKVFFFKINPHFGKQSQILKLQCLYLKY